MAGGEVVSPMLCIWPPDVAIKLAIVVRCRDHVGAYEDRDLRQLRSHLSPCSCACGIVRFASGHEAVPSVGFRSQPTNRRTPGDQPSQAGH